MENQTQKPMPLNRDAAITMLWCLALSLFWVIFLWNFWTKDINALGLNAFIFLIFTLFLFIRVLYYKKHYEKKDLYWIIPVALITFGYLIYNNPFIKAVNILVYPASIILFMNFGFLKDKDKKYWDVKFISRIIFRFFNILGKVGEAFNRYFDVLSPKNNKGRRTAGRTVIGIILFLLIASTLVIPLLSSADPAFAAKVDVVYAWIGNIISVTFIYKVMFFIVLAIMLLAAILAWGRPFDYEEGKERDKMIDPIVTGIVLGGILTIYLLFLWVQVARLFVGQLPFDFKETESLVKSGFWQLFFLTGINTLIYFFTYRKTNKPVQNILVAFTAASFLLLISAGYRMALYAIYYGLSYEKFFASYTVIYCAILFVWLFVRMFMKRRADIFKFVVFLFIWMYAVIAIMPIEQIILRTNVALLRLPDSRIRLYELTMLSPDVLSLVKQYKGQGLLEEKVIQLEREGEADQERNFDWQPWIEKQEKLIAEKKWYEKNITDFIN